MIGKLLKLKVFVNNNKKQGVFAMEVKAKKQDKREAVYNDYIRDNCKGWIFSGKLVELKGVSMRKKWDRNEFLEIHVGNKIIG